MTGPSNRLWDRYFLVVAVAVAIAAVLADGHSPIRRAIAIGAVAGMAVLYRAAARQRILRDEKSVPLAVACLPFFAVAVACVPLTTWLLFAVIPVLFMLTALRTAIALVAVVNIIPVVVQFQADPDGIAVDLVIAAISTAAGICIGAWITDMSTLSEQRAQLIAELEASRAELARLSRETGAAAERNRLAGEIHDTLAQGLTGIIAQLEAAEHTRHHADTWSRHLAQARALARANLTEARRSVRALRPGSSRRPVCPKRSARWRAPGPRGR